MAGCTVAAVALRFSRWIGSLSRRAAATARIWPGTHLCTVTGHSNWVNSVAYSPDGKHIVSGSTNFTVKLWDAQTGEEVSIRVEVMVMIGGCARRG